MEVIGGELYIAEAFAHILVDYMYEPNLGCASTRQLMEELIARLDGWPVVREKLQQYLKERLSAEELAYKTVPDV